MDIDIFAMRSRDPLITRPELDAFIERYEQYLADLPSYSDALAWWIARYSRGDLIQDLATAFPRVVEKVSAADTLERTKYKTDRPLFAHERRYAALFRDAVVLVSIALCLRTPNSIVMRLEESCERGDLLLETILASSVKKPPAISSQPAFPQFFGELYSAIDADSGDRSEIVAAYLAVWREERVKDFGFIIAHEKIGYWCFEAAGVVVAFGIDDRTFANHPHYPRDLVAFARRTGAS
jgi:hypothetical protein